MANNHIDAVNIFSDYNRFYYSKFTGSTGNVLITKDNVYFITDFRYMTQASNQCIGAKVLITDEVVTQSVVVNKIIKDEKIQTIGLEGDFITRNQWLQLEKTYQARLVDVDLKNIRNVKFEDEIEIMQKACDISDAAYAHLLEVVKVGMTEIEVESILTNKMKQLGAASNSFSAIVASGVRGCMPHGVASDKVIEDGDFVTVDFGALYKGYCSDMTRTFVMGKQHNPKLKEMYEIVLEANMLGISMVKPGVKGKDIDAAVRKFITDKGYGEYFKHGLGHGLGIQVHENPRLNYSEENELQPGNVVTVEPGIYIEGLGGIRIEDDVLVTETSNVILTKSTKQLKCIE